MKYSFIITLSLFAGSLNPALAQCSFTPSIETESKIMLCPNSQDTLWTQVYDSYQWYKAGNPIPGATLQYYVVDHYRDAGSRFSVEVTLDGCTEMSDEVLVDGWAFLGVTVTSGGNYQFDGSVHNLCDSTAMQDRDTMILTLNMPYNTNIQWFKDGLPIPGANGNVYNVTETGEYIVEGAPAVCPDFIQTLGVTIKAELRTPVKPVITADGDRLIAGPAGLEDFQWYFEGEPIPDANDSAYVPVEAGEYTVSASDGFCADLSDPYDFEELPNFISHVDIGRSVIIYPNPTTTHMYVKAPLAVNMNISTMDGRLLIQQQDAEIMDVSDLAPGLYILSAYDQEGRLIKTEKVRKDSAPK